MKTNLPSSRLLEAIPAGLGEFPKDYFNSALTTWVKACADLCEPDQIFYCDGSEQEKKFLLQEATRQGVLTPLNQEKLPGCYYHRSDPNDVARVEQVTFICTPKREDAGPTNRWADPTEMRDKLQGLLQGAMRGRTMFVVPYVMGHPGSSLSKVGVEITDSIYVVLNMRIMSRMGTVAYETLSRLGGDDFNRGLHSILDLNPERRYICHFPQNNEIISVGSGYGGNALLGKKCLALRIGSYLAKKQGWLAEHMLILCAEAPNGKKYYIAGAFPSACGKTNFAMMIPPDSYKLAGWKITTIGDDIAWMQPGPDGRLYAVNPEAGYFGVAPGTNLKSNPNAMATISHDTIYTNVGVTPTGEVWWEGKDEAPPANLQDWRGNAWDPTSGTPAAHPNSRFTSPINNNPALASEVEEPRGVPISAILFGARRSDTVPLIYQALNWVHGVYLGATLSSETTAAASGNTGQVRRDPMAMLPFCGYHMGDYFKHWLEIGQLLTRPPLVFRVNWFRKNAEGKFLWPGFGENIRVIEWIINRCENHGGAQETPIGHVPRREDINLEGIEHLTEEDFAQLMAIHKEEWIKACEEQGPFFESLTPRLPDELAVERRRLLARLQNSDTA